MSQFAFLVPLVAALAAGNEPAADEESVPLVGRYVVIDNVCAWPNLTTLRDGTILATIFNRPSHGRMEGDVECWASADGRFWERRGTAAAHEPSANRMNVAAGLDRDGKLVVLASGWSLKRDGDKFEVDQVLPFWSCRSADAREWTIERDAMPAPPEGTGPYIPFGDIFVAADGSLRASCYARVPVDADSLTKKPFRSWVFRSDDGNRWTRGSVIGPVHNETTLFHLGGDKWLAAARREYVELYRSDDDCQTWQSVGPLTERNEINGHLQRLADGRLLLSFGRRLAGRYGVGVRLSSDEGRTWSPPRTLIGDLANGDCGYPSSVQRPDGTIVTAYYASGVAAHQRYHMGVALWNPPSDEKGK
jgi:hypothetical protein